MDDLPVWTRGFALVTTAVSLALMAGCVATVQTVPPPPPRATYYAPPPPPPSYGAPSDDGEMQASEAPPELPDYDQPPCPEDGYLWTPGYWAFASGGYYWVPGTWVAPPRVGLLWTPGYWGVAGTVYVFHPGYWGPHVGFYGGVHYGYGYTGAGYAGGHWDGERFAYNRTVTNVNVTVVHNTYNETVVNNVTVNKISYNGGNGGVRAEATPQERQWEHEQHVRATPLQVQHVHEASSNPALFSRANGGRPAIAATPRPAAFTAPGAVGAHGAAMTQPPAQHPFTPPNSAFRPGGAQPSNGPAPAGAAQNNAFKPAPAGAPHPQAQVHAPVRAPSPPPAPRSPPPKNDPRKDQHTEQDRR